MGKNSGVRMVAAISSGSPHDAEIQCLVDFGKVAPDKRPEGQKDHTEKYQPCQTWDIGPAVVAGFPDCPAVGG